MFGNLAPTAIESLLHAEIVARIAYIDRRGLPCIVPITYAYDGKGVEAADEMLRIANNLQRG